ncbi:DUF7848 domain-containing protein [Jiangella alkaliphila]|nr:hypothetical protein [Jiangella alkaliphila]
MPTDQPAAPPAPAPRYRARCPACRWTGRAFATYGTAEDAARDHARDKHHTTFVLDQYDMRVVGSTIHPFEAY